VPREDWRRKKGGSGESGESGESGGMKSCIPHSLMSYWKHPSPILSHVFPSTSFAPKGSSFLSQNEQVSHQFHLPEAL
jgi:hypothetical protein